MENKKKQSKGKKVVIDGVEYIKKNGKLYGMPRTITTRKILRNRLKAVLKSNNITKVNRQIQHYWHDEEVRKKIAEM